MRIHLIPIILSSAKLFEFLLKERKRSERAEEEKIEGGKCYLRDL